MSQQILIETKHLFKPLNDKLIELLKRLDTSQWEAQTIAKQWLVKDVAAHLLDGNLRGLSTSRDQYFIRHNDQIGNYNELVKYLNQLNHSWTDAFKRVSPQLLIDMLEWSGPMYADHLNALDPMADSVFPVSWAGQKKSQNWFHIAREYTEKFLHQQQIRDAVNRQGILTWEFYQPFLATYMQALPNTFRDVVSTHGTIIAVQVLSEAGGEWQIIYLNNQWSSNTDLSENVDARVVIDADTAWKLFSGSLKPKDVLENVTLIGDRILGLKALEMVSVMA